MYALQLDQTPGHATMAGDFTATNWGVDTRLIKLNVDLVIATVEISRA